MVQVFDPTPVQGQAGQLGQALGMGIAKNFPAPEQLVQRKMLSEAFAALENPDLNYEQQLKAIVPTLMTTQGGAEALQTLAPILQARAKNRATRRGIEERQRNQPPSINERILTNEESNAQPIGATPGQITTDEAPDKFREPSPPGSKEPIYPQLTAGPQTTPIMSPAELENYAVNLMKQSDDLGTPISFQEAMGIAQTEQSNREAYNARISQEQKDRLNRIKDMNADIVERAVNAGLIESGDDEARTLAEKFAYEARNAGTPSEIWEYVRPKLREFNNAREGIRREASIPGPFTGLGRMLIGTYKQKEKVQKDLKPFVDTYKKFGLYDELRSELTGSIGMGPEDAETTIFPLSKAEYGEISRININTDQPKALFRKEPYPGSSFNIKDPKKFENFKENVAKFLDKYPKANLVTLRGKLNQDKRYSWEDISKAIGELMEEKRFIPDNYQYSQLSIINKAPLPGLAEQFKEWWTGTK